MLIGLISGIFILVLGGFIARYTINKFQKQNTILKTKNDLISEFEAFYSLLSQLMMFFNKRVKNLHDKEEWNRCNQLFHELRAKNVVVAIKIVNLADIFVSNKIQRKKIKLYATKTGRQVDGTIRLIKQGLSKAPNKETIEKIRNAGALSEKRISDMLIAIMRGSIKEEIEEEVIEEEEK